MNKSINKLIEYFLLFIIGGSIYYMIEIIYRGHSHYSMFILGGICLILIGIINTIKEWKVLFIAVREQLIAANSKKSCSLI